MQKNTLLFLRINIYANNKFMANKIRKYINRKIP